MTFRSIVTASSVLIAGAGVALAQSPEFEEETPEGLPSFLSPYDINGDQRLSVEERQAMNDQRKALREDKREAMDTDGDGGISPEERRSALQAFIIAKRTERFNTADTDGSGSLSRDEFGVVGRFSSISQASIDRIFLHLDSNEDGGIDFEEFMGHFTTLPSRATEGDSDSGTNGIPVSE